MLKNHCHTSVSAYFTNNDIFSFEVDIDTVNTSAIQDFLKYITGDTLSEYNDITLSLQYVYSMTAQTYKLHVLCIAQINTCYDVTAFTGVIPLYPALPTDIESTCSSYLSVIPDHMNGTKELYYPPLH